MQTRLFRIEPGSAVAYERKQLNSKRGDALLDCNALEITNAFAPTAAGSSASYPVHFKPGFKVGSSSGLNFLLESDISVQMSASANHEMIPIVII